MQIRLKQGKIALGAIMLAGLLAIPTFAQEAQQQQQESVWKDTAEYELVQNGIAKEQSPQKKIQLLQQWKEKYPDTKLKTARLQLFLQTYQALGNAAEMKKTATEMTAADPDGITGLIGYQTLNLLTFSMNDTSEQALSDGEKAAKGLLDIVEKVKKPDQVDAAAWDKETQNNKFLAHRTLGWVEWQRKNFTEAENHFIDALKIKPASGEVASWLGTVILLQRNTAKQAQGLYQFARAASIEGDGALPAAAKNQTKAYFEKTYENYRGSKDGIEEIYDRARTEPFPAEGFTIQSKAQLQAQDRNRLQSENPQLYLWLNIKDNLKGAEGASAFSEMKGSDAGLAAMNIAGFKGKLISATPETNPKELQLSVEDGLSPDVKIILNEPLRGKADEGIELEFHGAVDAFEADPYVLTFKVNPDDVKGWPSPRPATKKAAPKKAVKKK